MKLYREIWAQDTALFLRSMVIPVVLTAAAAFMAVMGNWEIAGGCMIALLVMLLVREAIHRLLSRSRKALK